MKNERLITITDLQTTAEGDDSLTITTRGMLRGTADDYSIFYDEDYGDGLRSKTEIKVQSRRRASIVRRGDITTELTVEQGKRHACQYSTPYGDLMMGIFGLHVDSSVNEDGGELFLDYTVDFNGELTAKKKMKITIR